MNELTMGLPGSFGLLLPILIGADQGGEGRP